MRTTKELLQILLNNKCYFENGLCVLAFNLWYNKIISKKEYLYIKEYLNSSNVITLRKLFGSPYFWIKGEWKPREKWLKSKIKKLK